MNALRMAAIIVLAIVGAVLALKVLAIVTFILFKLVTLVFFVALLVGLYMVARSAMGRSSVRRAR